MRVILRILVSVHLPARLFDHWSDPERSGRFRIRAVSQLAARTAQVPDGVRPFRVAQVRNSWVVGNDAVLTCTSVSTAADNCVVAPVLRVSAMLMAYEKHGPFLDAGETLSVFRDGTKSELPYTPSGGAYVAAPSRPACDSERGGLPGVGLELAHAVHGSRR